MPRLAVDHGHLDVLHHVVGMGVDGRPALHARGQRLGPGLRCATGPAARRTRGEERVVARQDLQVCLQLEPTHVCAEQPLLVEAQLLEPGHRCHAPELLDAFGLGGRLRDVHVDAVAQLLGRLEDLGHGFGRVGVRGVRRHIGPDAPFLGAVEAHAEQAVGLDLGQRVGHRIEQRLVALAAPHRKQPLHAGDHPAGITTRRPARGHAHVGIRPTHVVVLVDDGGHARTQQFQQVEGHQVVHGLVVEGLDHLVWQGRATTALDHGTRVGAHRDVCVAGDEARQQKMAARIDALGSATQRLRADLDDPVVAHAHRDVVFHHRCIAIPDQRGAGLDDAVAVGRLVRTRRPPGLWRLRHGTTTRKPRTRRTHQHGAEGLAAAQPGALVGLARIPARGAITVHLHVAGVFVARWAVSSRHVKSLIGIG